MKRWQVILDLVCDVSKYLNTDVSQNSQKISKKEVNNKSEINEGTGEDDTRDLNVISDLLKQHEKLQKTSEEDLKIMNSFLDSIANLSDDEA